MRKGLLLGAIFGTIFGIGIPPLVQFGWDKFWGYLGGGIVTVTEAELMRSIIIVVLLAVVGCLVYWWGTKEENSSTNAIKEAFKEAVRELKEEWSEERKGCQSEDATFSVINRNKPEDTNVNQ